MSEAVSKSMVRYLNFAGTRMFTTSFNRKAVFKVQDDKDFSEKVENSRVPIIVNFSASWCGPCKLLEPRLDKIMAKRKGIALAKVDIHTLREIAMKYEIRTIPSLVVFKNGKVRERLVGLQDEDKLSTWVDEIIMSNTAG